MSILSTRLVADPVARLFAATVNPAPKPAVRFPEIAGRTTTVSIPTRHGDTTATVYHPAARDSRRPAVYVNIHGGGFVVGHREQDDPWCRYLAAHADVVVVNTDYVLAPHRRFPAPVEQIYDVLQWASSSERDWEGTELCLGGQSAGGNLAFLASRRTRLAFEVLHYPTLDLVRHATGRCGYTAAVDGRGLRHRLYSRFRAATRPTGLTGVGIERRRPRRHPPGPRRHGRVRPSAR